MASPDITLHTYSTPNGVKVSITLEELGLPYKVNFVSLENLEQKHPEFLKINPVGKIPALTDHDFNVFESGAIMLYLCETYDLEEKLLPKDPKLKSQVIQWVMFQMAGLGPMQGQANYFNTYSPEHIPYCIERYTKETKKYYTILNDFLEKKEYLVGNRYTLADIANYSSVKFYLLCGIPNLDDLPNLKAWVARIDARPATQKGIDVPNTGLRECIENPEKLEEFSQRVKAIFKKMQENK
ncbi:14099_t:CDS:2 [Funneliformis caledonium]|uniref:14099_t:CDS:1 n=1 Tax=Funneliformis caledonium TaxID=1117310 RepID=A0A9N9DCJ2_9GLOM|nr:14099_t:CDS:2 [Funneliformis caledonium]